MIDQQELYDIVRPEPESLLQSARSFGYSIETAIADLIDNSITAGANEITITYGIDNFSSFVRIEDNGRGMTENELLNAMKIGSFNPLHSRQTEDLGRFGLGLKTASFSQCRRLTVKSRKDPKNEYVRCWDLDFVTDKKDWVLLKTYVDDKSAKNVGNFSLGSSGTIVLWEKLDRLVESSENESSKEHFYRKFENVKRHIGLIFHRFIEENQISFKIQGNEVFSLNPFNISLKIPSTELAEEHLSISGQSIIIQPYVLPHESKLTTNEKSQLQLMKGWTEHQGIYLYRNKRLISEGSWLDLGFRKKESQRLCRIAIDIPNTLDKEWHIDVKKSSAKIPDTIRKRIKEICFNSIDKAVKVYSHRGAYLKRKDEKKEITYFWKAKQKNGKRFYEVNRQHPIYGLISQYLQEHSYILDDYIKLIGESLPINFIVTDFADPKMTMKDFFEDSKGELKIIYSNTIAALVNNGMSEKEAIEKVDNIECFQQLNKNS